MEDEGTSVFKVAAEQSCRVPEVQYFASSLAFSLLDTSLASDFSELLDTSGRGGSGIAGSRTGPEHVPVNFVFGDSTGTVLHSCAFPLEAGEGMSVCNLAAANPAERLKSHPADCLKGNL